MSASKSPTHSHGAVPSKRRSYRRTKSVCSASSNTSIRLTAVVEDSFQLSPMPSRMSVLNDRTDIQEPGRQSWWKRIGENSRRVTEIMEERDAEVVRTVNVADQFDVEVLSQENENMSIDLPESSDGESIHSIVLERRKMFVQQEDRPVNKTKEFIRNKENLVKSQKSYFDKTNNINIEQDIVVMPKKLFNAVPRPKTRPTFTAALINASANKTVSKSPEQPVQKVPVRNLFSNRPVAKRKNNFAAFLLSDSEDEIPDVQPRMFGFQKTKEIENQQIAKQPKRSVSQSSVRSSVSNMTDVDMEQWKQLPSSTMLEEQFELVGTTPNKTRLSRLSKARYSGVTKRQSNSINKSSNSNQSHKPDEPNPSKKSNQSKVSNANVHKITLTEGDMQVDEVQNENFTLEYDDDDEQIFDIPGKGGNKNQEQDVIEEEGTETQQGQKQIQDGIVSEKEKQEENKSEREIVEENRSAQEFEEENENEREIEEENRSEQDIEEENESEQEIEEENESEQESQEENENDQENQQEQHVTEEERNETQHQMQDEEVNNTKNQAENISEHEIIEENECHQEYQNEKGKSNNEEINNKTEEDIQIAQFKEKSYNLSRNNCAENNTIIQSVDKHNQKEYPKLDCRENSAQESEKMDTENINNNEDEEENMNPNENAKINSKYIEDAQNTNLPEAVIQNKTGVQENINSSDKQVDSENVGNIEDEQDAKSPEAVLLDKTERGESFDIHCHRTTNQKSNTMIINKSKTIIKDFNIRPSLVPARESIGLTDGSLNSSAEGSGWDSHRTTRKTLRQTFGKDITPRKSLRTLVMERTAKRQAQNQNNEIADVSKQQPLDLKDRNKRQTNFNDITSKMPLANSTEFPAFESYREDEVSLTTSAREPEKSKMPIVNSSILRVLNKEKEQVEESQAGRNQDKHENIDSGSEPERIKEIQPDIEQDIENELDKEQDEEIEQDTEQDSEVEADIEQNEEIEPDTEHDEEIEPDTEQDEEIEPDTEQDKEIEPDTEQDEEIESDAAQEDEELESHTEQHQTEEMESDSEQNHSENIDSHREHQTKDIESDGEQEADEMETFDSRCRLESYRGPDETLEESDDEISINLSQDRSLQTNVQKIIRENAEKRRKLEEHVMNSLNQGKKPFNLFKMPEVPKQIPITKIKKPTKAKAKQSPFFTGTLPPEFLEDMKYKPPKRFTGKNAPWITKRLYKYLEEKLEPKYDYRARVRAECLVEKLYYFAKDVRKRIVAPRDAVDDLKREMATLGIVNTHYEFYCFFHDFMPREIRIRVNPDVLNNIPADRRVFGNILSDGET